MAAAAPKPLEKPAKKLANSAEKMERSTARVEDSADRRTELAANRTVFAAERTYAAWVRTGLFSLASGAGAKALLGGHMPDWVILATGTTLVLFSCFCFVAGVWRNLNPGAPTPQPDAPRIHPAILITINLLLGIVALTTLIGVWYGETPVR